MNPRKLPTKPIGAAEARGRRKVAETYLEVAHLISNEDGTAINVCVGMAVLAGIAAADAICAASLGERYSGTDHHAAASLLERVDPRLGRVLRSLVELKGASHYGHQLLTISNRTAALRNAAALVTVAVHRTGGVS